MNEKDPEEFNLAVAFVYHNLDKRDKGDLGISVKVEKALAIIGNHTGIDFIRMGLITDLIVPGVTKEALKAAAENDVRIR